MDVQEALTRIKDLRPKWPQNLALQAFDSDRFTTLSAQNQQRLLRCMRSGIENPDSAMGAYAGSETDYENLDWFFANLISKHHGVAQNARHESGWERGEKSLDVADIGLPPLSVRVRVGRNIAGQNFPSTMDKDQRLDLENRVSSALLNSPIKGRYVSLSPGSDHHISTDTYQQMIDRHLLFKPMDNDPYLASAGVSADWPHGRGAFVSQDENFLVWIGEEDHLRIMLMEKTSNLSNLLKRFESILNDVESILEARFAQSKNWGYLTSCPTNLGTGMRASVHMQLPKLTEGGSDEQVKALAKPLGLSIRGLGGEHTPVGADGTVDISPSARFAITEAQIIERLYDGIGALKYAEDQA